MTDETPVSEDASDQPKATSASGEEAPKKRRGRRPKAEAVPSAEVPQQSEGAPAADAPAPVKPKRTYTRRKPKAENAREFRDNAHARYHDQRGSCAVGCQI